MDQNYTGILYIIPTPIGNLNDISNRAIHVLQKVDLIAAEDTRHTLNLLKHFNIKTNITSFYEYNEVEKTKILITILKKKKLL